MDEVAGFEMVTVLLEESPSATRPDHRVGEPHSTATTGRRASARLSASRGRIAADRHRQVTVIRGDTARHKMCSNIVRELGSDTARPALLLASIDESVHSAAAACQVVAALAECLDDPVVAVDLSASGLLAKSLVAERTGVVRGVTTGPIAMPEAVIQTSYPGLCLLPVGTDVSRSAISAMLDELRAAFGMVAVFGGHVSEGRATAVASCCTGGLLLIGQNVTKKRQATVARDQLRCAGASLLGCILATPN